MSGGLQKIGELAKATGCNIGTIRYYEREGLLPAPARSEGNYRLYGNEHVERLCFTRPKEPAATRQKLSVDSTGYAKKPSTRVGI